MSEKKYYYLKKGEIVQPGDEVETSNSFHDDPVWETAKHSVGKPAPDPRFPAHRKFRRLAHDMESKKDE